MHKILDNKIETISILNIENNKIPIVVSIPHSGIYLTKKMNENLRDGIILPNMDWYLPELYSFLKNMEVTVIINNVSRYVIDCNRSIKQNIDKLDNSYQNSFIYTRTTFDKQMYINNLDIEEVNSRISNYYKPYYEEIEKAIICKLRTFNKVYFLDLHSFGKVLPADIVLGNVKGESSSEKFLNLINNIFTKEGFKIQNNTPYRGGNLVKYFSKRIEKCEAIQIEINYNSYINNRVFGEEEMPQIKDKIFRDTQLKLKNSFLELIKILTY